MSCNIVRFRQSNKISWGVIIHENIYPVSGNYHLLSDFLKEGVEQAKKLAKNQEGKAINLNSVEILSPVTPPCNIVCQGSNYMDHIIEIGSKPERPKFNLLFSKASSSLTSAQGQVIRPPNVKLLDYELELGLVIGHEINEPQLINRENLAEFIVGIVMVNDISARDIQIPQGQWYKGKSYRTFCPTGPYLCLLDKSEYGKLSDLQLTLKVNGKTRQNANTRQLIYSPAETLEEISEIMDLSIGDLVITGTPGGVSLKAPGRMLQKLASLLLSEHSKMRLFVQSQLKNPRYLKNGDVIQSTIHSSDGQIYLGVQELQVVGGHIGNIHES
jgi:2-keto-4-pentenoate hydratase/2-oxohepta-3-ene-1,7-dioic acid hydratase in catechol pathway